MFTGIVEELGEVVEIVQAGDSARLTLRGPKVVSDAQRGDSIAVNGVCLTVVGAAPADVDSDGPASDGPAPGCFTADVMHETLRRSSLGALEAGSRVNLERAASVNGRLGGHIVQGHVDTVARILARIPHEHWEAVRISLPPEVSRYVVEKGSITVDGVSLTVSALDSDHDGAQYFEVSLIPETLESTVLGVCPVGARVNLEADVIAKYVERLLDGAAVPDA